MADYSISRSNYLKIMLGNTQKEISSLNSQTINQLNDTSFDAVESTNRQIDFNNQSIAQAEEKVKDSSDSRNWWQRTWDTIQQVSNDVTQGILNFADDIFDFAINVSGEVGSWFGASTEWSKDLTSYDWQSQATNALSIANPYSVMTGDIFSSDYWNDIDLSQTGSQKKLSVDDSNSWFSEIPEDNFLNQNFLKSLGQGAGYMVPSIIIGAATGGTSLGTQTAFSIGGEAVTYSQLASLATMGLGAFTGSTNDAYDETGNLALSSAYGLASASVEIGTELLVGPALAKAGVGVNTIAGRTASGVTAKSFTSTLVKSMIEEGAEEAVSGILDPVISSIYKGSTAFKSDDGKFIYFDKDFWFGNNDSVLAQATSGALLGGVMSGVSLSQQFKELGQEGVAVVDLLEENRNLYKDLSKYDAESTEYKNISNQMAENTAKISAYYAIIGSSGNQTQIDNITKLLTDPQSLINELNAEKNKGKTEQEISQSLVETRLEEMKDINKFGTRNLFEDLQNRFNSDYTLEFSQLENETNAKVDNKTKTITINSNLEGQYAPVLAHEYIGHVLMDAMSSNTRQSVFDKVVNTDWYKKNAKKLRESYSTTDEYKSLSKANRTTYWQTEVINKYLENVLTSSSNAKSTNMINDIFLRNTILNRLNAKFNKSNNLNQIKNNAVLSEIVGSVEELFQTIDKQAYNVLKKVVDGKKLSSREEKIYKKYKNIIDQYKEIKEKTQTQYSKELDPYETNKANEIKEGANEKEGKVVSYKSVKDIYNAIEKGISDVIGTDFSIDSKNQKARRLFEEWNIAKNDAKKTNIKKFVSDIFEQNIEGVDYTYKDLLEARGLNYEEMVENGTNTMYDLLNEKAITSETTKKINKLKKLIQKVQQANQEQKATVKFIKKLNSIQKNLAKIDQKYNNTGQLDTKSGISGLFNKFFSRFRFTKNGYTSLTNLTHLQEMVQDGSFNNLIDQILNPNNEVSNLPTLVDNAQIIKDMALELANSETAGQVHMSYEQTETFNNLNKAIYKLYKDYTSGILESARNQANDLIESVKKVSTRYKVNGVTNTIKKFSFDMVDPKTILAYALGGTDSEAFKMVYNELYKKPYEKQIGKYVDFLKLRDENTSEIKKLQFKRITVDGVKMRKYVLFQFYLNTLSEENNIRMKNSNLAFTNKSGTTTKISYSALYAAMNKYVTEAEKTNLKAIFDLYNTELKSYVEEVSYNNLGFSVSRENYYPIVSSDAYKIKNLTNVNESAFNINALTNGRLKKLSNRKTVIEINVNPLELYQTYVRNMTITGEIGLASQKLNRLFQLKNSNGESVSTVVSEYLPNAQTYISSIFNKLIGNSGNVESSSILMNRIGQFSTAKLGLNIRSIFKQVGSYFTAWGKVGFTTGLKTMFSPSTYSNIYKYRNYIKENNNVFKLRIYENGYLRGATLSAGVDAFTSNALKQTLNFSLKGMEMVDRFICYNTYGMAQEYVKKAYGYEIGTEQNLKAASEVFTDIILETQSNSDRIAMSRVRAGERGMICKLMFGLFASDAQNKFSQAYTNIIDLTNNQKTIKEIETDLKNAKSNQEQLSKDLESAKRTSKKTYQRTGAAVAGLIASAVVTTLADMLADLLYDKKDLEDEKVGDLLLDILSNTTIEWFPYFNQIYNWFKYGSADISALGDINTLIEKFQDFTDGEITSQDMIQLGMEILEFMGIPMNNAYKLVNGIIGNFNPNEALRIKNLFYSTSQSYMSQQANDYIESGNLDKAKAIYSFNYSTYKMSASDSMINEIVNLKENGITVSVKNAPTTYTDSAGNEVKMTDEEIETFKSIYDEAAKRVDSLIKDNNYQKLSMEEKAKAIKKVTDAYYEIAKYKSLKTTPSSRLAKYYAYASDKTNISRDVAIMSYLNNVIEESSNKKVDFLSTLNKINGLSKNDKLLITTLMGYSVSDSNKASLQQYLKSKGLSNSEISELING